MENFACKHRNVFTLPVHHMKSAKFFWIRSWLQYMCTLCSISAWGWQEPGTQDCYNGSGKSGEGLPQGWDCGNKKKKIYMGYKEQQSWKD